MPSCADNNNNNEPLSRPNKYHGPPSTWRNWTAAERELAASLQQLTANDLSVHLYNAFRLKNWSRKRRERRGAEQYEEDFESSQPWLPPKVWTAWPLPPDVVPREGEISRWEEPGDRSRQYHGRRGTNSNSLKEVLVGHVLKKAKERFRARQLEDDQPSDVIGKPRRKVESQSGHSQDSGEDSSMSSSDTRDRGRAERLAARPEGDVNDDEQQSQNSEVSFQEGYTAGPLRGYPDKISDDSKPEVMVDDEKASDILEPTLNHILAKLDRLLMGLHYARSAYAASSDPASISRKGVDRSRRSSLGKRKRSKSKHRSSRAQSCNLSSTGSDNDTAKSKPPPNSRTRSQEAAPSRRNRKTKIGLRDWSDVLGVASMTGWESAVVDSAITRCAALFDEGVTFRTLVEGRNEFEEVSYIPGTGKRTRVERLNKNFLE